MFSLPFSHFTATAAFGYTTSHAVLAWLEACACWRLVEASFYEQYEIDVATVEPPPHIQFLTGRPFLDEVRLAMERIFRVQMDQSVDCTAHKLVGGQYIDTHNDFRESGETHRLLIQLNRGWRAKQGGFLGFFNALDALTADSTFLPVHDSAIGFAISETSYHSVSTVERGERFTLVFSFRAIA